MPLPLRSDEWLTIINSQLIIVIFLFVETRGSTLEEIGAMFDGKDHMEHLQVTALEAKSVAANDGEVTQVEDVRRTK